LQKAARACELLRAGVTFQCERLERSSSMRTHQTGHNDVLLKGAPGPFSSAAERRGSEIF
jgi:hypothetical protein